MLNHVQAHASIGRSRAHLVLYGNAAGVRIAASLKRETKNARALTCNAHAIRTFEHTHILKCKIAGKRASRQAVGDSILSQIEYLQPVGSSAKFSHWEFIICAKI